MSWTKNRSKSKSLWALITGWSLERFRSIGHFVNTAPPQEAGFRRAARTEPEDIPEKIRKFVALWDSPNRIQYQGAPFSAGGYGRGEVALAADEECPFPHLARTSGYPKMWEEFSWLFFRHLLAEEQGSGITEADEKKRGIPTETSQGEKAINPEKTPTATL